MTKLLLIGVATLALMACSKTEKPTLVYVPIQSESVSVSKSPSFQPTVVGTAPSRIVASPYLAPPGRLVFQGDNSGIVSVCDKGNRLYINEPSGSFFVIPNQCPDGQP